MVHRLGFLHLLGRHILRRADCPPGFGYGGFRLPAYDFGDPKVGDLHPALFV